MLKKKKKHKRSYDLAFKIIRALIDFPKMYDYDRLYKLFERETKTNVKLAINVLYSLEIIDIFGNMIKLKTGWENRVHEYISNDYTMIPFAVYDNWLQSHDSKDNVVKRKFRQKERTSNRVEDKTIDRVDYCLAIARYIRNLPVKKTDTEIHEMVLEYKLYYCNKCNTIQKEFCGCDKK